MSTALWARLCAMGLLGALSFLFSFLNLPATAIANDSAGDSANLLLEGELLKLGGSCAALAYIDENLLRAQIRDLGPNETKAFCYPEEPFDCSDYTSFLRGVGSLSASEEASNYCALSAN